MENTVSVDIEGLRIFINSSIRYALPRMTYITGLTVDICMELPKEVWDERTLSVALQDLKRYFDDWERGYKPNMDCDYSEWKRLQKYLLEIKEENGNHR